MIKLPTLLLILSLTVVFTAEEGKKRMKIAQRLIPIISI